MIRAEILFIARKKKFFLELEQLLLQGGIAATWAVNSRGAPSHFDTDRKQMVVLDCPAEGVIHSLTLSQEIRNHYSGLLLLISGQDDSEFHCLALGSGIDASLAYATGTALICANIQALLRRFAPQKPAPRLMFGKLILDARRRDAFVDGQAVELSTTEFQILWALAQKPGYAVSREEIHQDLYKTAYQGYDRRIDLYVSRIRQKIGDHSERPRFLKTVRGIGYQFIAEENGLTKQYSPDT